MTTPTVVTRTGNAFSTAASSYALGAPITATGAQVGDLDIVVFSSDCVGDVFVTLSVDAGSSEWSIIASGQTSTGQGNATSIVLGREVTVANTVQSLTINSTGSNKAAWRAYRLRPASGEELTAEVASLGGAGSNGNPPNLAFGGGTSRAAVVIAAWTGDGANFPSGGPSGYSNFTLTQTSAGSSTGVATADITVSATSEDPGAFTHSAEGWHCYTIGVYGEASGGPSPITADAAITEAGDTVSAASALTIAGTASITESGDILSADGGAGTLGEAAISEASDTLSSAAALSIAAAASLSEAADTITAAGALALVGFATIDEAADTLAAIAAISGDNPQTTAIWTPVAYGLAVEQIEE